VVSIPSLAERGKEKRRGSEAFLLAKSRILGLSSYFGEYLRRGRKLLVIQIFPLPFVQDKFYK
jgi:hypothetical protein